METYFLSLKGTRWRNVREVVEITAPHGIKKGRMRISVTAKSRRVSCSSAHACGFGLAGLRVLVIPPAVDWLLE